MTWSVAFGPHLVDGLPLPSRAHELMIILVETVYFMELSDTASESWRSLYLDQSIPKHRR
jgi:hypothetical protein